ncbi:MAG: hypothetical protein LUC43_00100 [Burkholderiales bacterium]|nr:hypothetical protein [Burkholderiales bacterium]
MEEKEEKWLRTDGTRIACKEKIKVLTENRQEITSLLQDALEDAILMGCSEKSFKEVYMDLLNSLKASYPEQK